MVVITRWSYKRGDRKKGETPLYCHEFFYLTKEHLQLSEGVGEG